MPGVLKRRLHGFMRARLLPAHLVASGFAIGAMVTLLESVCTGQVYLPALMVMAREPQHRFHGLGLLALYNLMFVVPVAIVMAAAWRGTGSAVLVRWSQRNVVWGKSLMAAFFIGLAVLVLLL